jgi:hypothetical protein
LILWSPLSKKLLADLASREETHEGHRDWVRKQLGYLKVFGDDLETQIFQNAAGAAAGAVVAWAGKEIATHGADALPALFGGGGAAARTGFLASRGGGFGAGNFVPAEAKTFARPPHSLPHPPRPSATALFGDRDQGDFRRSDVEGDDFESAEFAVFGGDEHDEAGGEWNFGPDVQWGDGARVLHEAVFWCTFCRRSGRWP